MQRKVGTCTTFYRGNNWCTSYFTVESRNSRCILLFVPAETEDVPLHFYSENYIPRCIYCTSRQTKRAAPFSCGKSTFSLCFTKQVKTPPHILQRKVPFESECTVHVSYLDNSKTRWRLYVENQETREVRLVKKRNVGGKSHDTISSSRNEDKWLEESRSKGHLCKILIGEKLYNRL